MNESFDRSGIQIFEKLTPIKDQGFYLAGGTNLALQIGHRKSDDFDFFRLADFDPIELAERVFAEVAPGKVTFTATNTLYLEIEDIKFSFFGFKYPQIGESLIYPNIELASLADIAAMKLFAILKRATKKDYVDIYYLLQKYSLQEMFGFFDAKYGAIVEHALILKALCYFGDLEGQDIILSDVDLSFGQITTNIIKCVRAFHSFKL